MKKYQWLLFDADGTLFDYDGAESVALRKVFESIGVTFDPEYLRTYQRINDSLWQAVERGESTAEFVKARRFELFLEAIGLSYPARDFSNRYLLTLGDCSELLEDAGEVVLALKENYRLAILTNGLQIVQRRRLARSIISPHITEIIISEEIGFAKPAREYFDIALARLGNPPVRETLMIGDGWASDVVGARQYGMDACWYNPKRQPRPTGCDVTREISSLRELVDWLG
jgi:2-haloacid dehalogenase